MTFANKLVCLFFPGAVFILLSGLLSDVLPGIALGMGFVGFFVLIGWPIFSIVVEVRHDRRLKRQQRQHSSEPGPITETRRLAAEVPVTDPLFTFVSGVEAVIMMFALPILLLGGLGVFCLVTLDEDPDTTIVKAICAVACLALLGGYLLIILRGRTPLTLRIVGITVAVFGLAGLVAVASAVVSDGGPNVADVIMAVTSVVMIAVGLWLAITGRNDFRRESFIRGNRSSPTQRQN